MIMCDHETMLNNEEVSEIWDLYFIPLLEKNEDKERGWIKKDGEYFADLLSTRSKPTRLFFTCLMWLINPFFVCIKNNR